MALNNLALTYNPQAGTLDVSANLEHAVTELVSDPGFFLCGLVDAADPTGVVCDLVMGLFGKNRAATEGVRPAPARPSLATAMGVSP